MSKIVLFKNFSKDQAHSIMREARDYVKEPAKMDDLIRRKGLDEHEEEFVRKFADCHCVCKEPHDQLKPL